MATSIRFDEMSLEQRQRTVATLVHLLSMNHITDRNRVAVTLDSIKWIALLRLPSAFTVGIGYRKVKYNQLHSLPARPSGAM